ncbi:signal peptidase II [Alkalimarinus sediminis]|uniref:Lipoprotein signal peptidase n=1 Tax=Alkalimarinus sediminis TaxID=1632866 RepID=A0A9E8KMZ3_9ALTE|nr:signal peptidase II [Alkalimarinus sediminis]UZW73898.1 signal peptidase II [Alkalimarinus sediminis]
MLKWLWLSAVVVVLDLGTKWLATDMLDYAISVPVLPFFNFTLLHNTGAAFSFLANAGGWQRWFFAALAVAISVMLVKWLASIKGDKWLAIAIALVLGGALGNLYDRVLLGYVVDFLHFYWESYHFPAFNVADSAITVGAIMMALDIFRKPNEDEPEKA